MAMRLRARAGPNGLRDCRVPEGQAAVMRDNRAGTGFDRDSRAGYRHAEDLQGCPAFVPLAAVRHRPAVLAADPWNREYTPPDLSRLRRGDASASHGAGPHRSER
jgi:hypothetical protein